VSNSTPERPLEDLASSMYHGLWPVVKVAARNVLQECFSQEVMVRCLPYASVLLEGRPVKATISVQGSSRSLTFLHMIERYNVYDAEDRTQHGQPLPKGCFEISCTKE
jgi:hypothetical protein